MTVIPKCPNCGQQMRACHDYDRAECRCGFEVDSEVLFALVGVGPLTVEHGRMGKPHVPEPRAAGIRISDKWSSEVAADRWDMRLEKCPGPARQEIHAAAKAHGRMLGLEYQGEAKGQYLIAGVADDTRRLERHKLYACAPVSQVMTAVQMMMAHIHAKHGAGRWWGTGGCVGYMEDDGRVRVADIDGVTHVFLRAYYFHDSAVAVGARCPNCGGAAGTKTATVSGVTITGCQCVPADRAVVVQRIGLQHKRYRVQPVTPAGRVETVLEMAQRGDISVKQAKEFLEMPQVPSDTSPTPARIGCIGRIHSIRGCAVTLRSGWNDYIARPVVGQLVRLTPQGPDCDGSRMGELRVANIDAEAGVIYMDRSIHNVPAAAEFDYLIAYADERTLAVCERSKQVPAEQAAFQREYLGEFTPNECGPVRVVSTGPLDEIIDGRSLRWCLEIDARRRREADLHVAPLTSAQRAAASAHWSAELRKRVAAAPADPHAVSYCEVEPWE